MGSILGQLSIFFYSLVGGIIVAFLYDIFRIKRKAIKTPDIFVALEDILFWIIASVVLVLVTFIANSGEIRGYIIAGAAIGAFLYLFTLSKLLLKIADAVIFVLRKIFNIIKTIILFPFKILFKILKKIFKKPVLIISCSISGFFKNIKRKVFRSRIKEAAKTKA